MSNGVYIVSVDAKDLFLSNYSRVVGNTVLSCQVRIITISSIPSDLSTLWIIALT